MPSVQPLEKIDIVLSMYNQEKLIERVLFGIFKSTTTPFHLILVFDGCTDRTKPRALAYTKKRKPPLLYKLTTRDAPNVFETRANNIGFRLAENRYMITLQDDMVVKEYGWERRLTYPLRAFGDVLAVTSRIAQDIVFFDEEKEEYTNRAGRELSTLPRTIFAVRDIINRGPVAFRMDYLKSLNFLNEKYAPCMLDDADISLRAWRQHRWKVGAFWIDYDSRIEWGKTRAKDSSMPLWRSNTKNKLRIMEDHGEYITSGQKHSENIEIPEENIDYCRRRPLLFSILFHLQAPRRYDMHDAKNAIRAPIRAAKQAIKPLLLSLLQKLGFRNVQRKGIKRSLFPFLYSKKK